ncbi:hypothetical protein AKO67_17610 [Flavobacterium sp. VMW]|nr:hypothetical protein AKO67_17610 [Flavobacterium sp. VMW]
MSVILIKRFYGTYTSQIQYFSTDETFLWNVWNGMTSKKQQTRQVLKTCRVYQFVKVQIIYIDPVIFSP